MLTPREITQLFMGFQTAIEEVLGEVVGCVDADDEENMVFTFYGQDETDGKYPKVVLNIAVTEVKHDPQSAVQGQLL